MKYELEEGRLEQQIEEWKPAYTKAEAVAEANRCLYCSDAPCIQACPTSIDIPTFIKKISSGNVVGSARTILAANILGYSCARVCPVEVLCVGSCVYNNWNRAPIQIGKLQRHAVEQAWDMGAKGLFPEQKAVTGKRVALVGAGPASIAAAALLALEGHHCVVFDKKSLPGGLNTFGIAPYKMHGHDSLREIEWVAGLEQVEFRLGIEVVERAAGPDQVSASELLGDYDAVFLGIGIGADKMLGIPGEGSGTGADERVLGATWWIEQIKGNRSYQLPADTQRALVVGGGNTALDAAHELRALNVPEVWMVYRRSEKEMPGYKHELAAARKDGVQLVENLTPIEVIREDGGRVGLKVAKAVNGRAVEGADRVIPADLIVMAIGQDKWGHTKFVELFEGVGLDDKGRVVVDPETHRTGNSKVWSGGDCVNGGKEVVNAVEHAKIAVRDMLTVLNGA